MHEGILRGVRGPRGGYELGREPQQITAVEILRAAGTVDDEDNNHLPTNGLIGSVVLPAIAQAERAFGAALNEISIDQLVRRARASYKSIYAPPTLSCSRSGLFGGPRSWG